MNKLKIALKNNEVSFGTWIQIPHSSIVEIIAYNCNNKLDWICIDMEHGSIDLESMVNLISTIEKFSMIPIVRIPKNDYIWIHRVLDAGAKGLIIPMINNREQLKYAINESKYAPIGSRSFGYSRANKFGFKFKEYIDNINDEIVIIAQIEHINAINNLQYILLEEECDATIIGPYDLSGSMGIVGEFEDKEFKKVLKIYLKISCDYNKPSGIHLVESFSYEEIKTTIQNGYKFIALGTDAIFLGKKVKEILKNIKN